MTKENHGVSKSTNPRRGEPRPKDEKFRARVKVNGREHFLGYFASETAAAKAVDEYRGIEENKAKVAKKPHGRRGGNRA